MVTLRTIERDRRNLIGVVLFLSFSDVNRRPNYVHLLSVCVYKTIHSKTSSAWNGHVRAHVPYVNILSQTTTHVVCACVCVVCVSGFWFRLAIIVLRRTVDGLAARANRRRAH